MKSEPSSLPNLNKMADEIIDLFCVVDDKPYPNGTGIWGKDTEIYSTDKNETARDKARRDVINIVAKYLNRILEENEVIE